MKEQKLSTLPPSLNRTRTFEIFVQNGFSELELASVTTTLQTANQIRTETIFKWQFVSDKPGLVKGSSGVLVRAAPAIENHGLADLMIVIGSQKPETDVWLKRVRYMQRQGLITILLSGAATAYIRATKITHGAVTTHWRDSSILHETGYYPRLTSRFSEKSRGVITAAGSGSTAELLIGIIAEFMSPHEVAELGSNMLIHTIRRNTTEQPKHMADNTNLFDGRIRQALSLMENAIEEPLSVLELTQEMGLSQRQLERIFNAAFEMSPARFYRKLRAKRARVLLDETQISLADVACATGFTSAGTLSKAFRDAFGETPSEMRSRKKTKLLDYVVKN